MKAAPHTLAAIIMALVVAVLPIGANADDQCRRPGTPMEAKALAEEAAAHLAKEGMGKAFNDFMQPDKGFMPYDLYVFVIDDQGRMWVNGRFPGMIGSNIGAGGDVMGKAITRARREGSAWAEYQWYNPCSGSPMPKSTYILRAGEFFIGVGAYGRLSV